MSFELLDRLRKVLIMTIKVKKEIGSDEMLRLQDNQPITTLHANVVFPSKKVAETRDMKASIGRFHPETQAITFFDDHQHGTKFKALRDNGFEIHLTKNNDGNWYVDIDSVIAKIRDREITESLTDNDEDLEYDRQKVGNRPELVYKEENDFLEQDNDAAMDLSFTTDDLGFEHRVGLYNEIENTYTLREDVKDLLEDFSFSIDENDEGVVANIDNSSINPRKLLLLIKLLKKQEQEDDEELREAIETDRVQVDSLAAVKSLLRRLALAQKHGEIEESEDAEIELNQLLAKYRDANPPAQGIEKVEAERDEILTKSKEVEQAQTPDEETESLDEKLKRDSAKAMDAMSILEASGIQIRGQQYVS